MIVSSRSCFKLTPNKNIQLHCRECHSGRQRSKSPHQDQQVLEESGWRFFDHATGKANIALEPKVKLTMSG